MKKILLALILVFIFSSCKDEVVDVINLPPVNQSPLTSSFDSEFTVQWMGLMLDIVTLEDIPAPICSRLYGYCEIAIYESVLNGMPGHFSLSGQLRDMPSMPLPENEIYDWPSVLASTLKKVSSNILYQPQQFSLDMIDNLYNDQIAERKTTIEESVVNRSVAYGQEIANKIIEWSNSDNFLATRNLPFNRPTGNPAYWEPTTPGVEALEPYLGTQKPFCMNSQGQCTIPLGIAFDTIPGTPFYQDANEVLQKSQNLTTDEMNIAFFWEDKVGTPRPPGHWVSITNNMVQRFSLTLDASAEIYALVGAIIRDAFISAWEAKYRVFLLRPKTYIRRYLGEPNWDPIVNTPPFPEFPSGHSVVSGGVSRILTYYFGDNIVFTDSTHHNEPGLRNRTFNSFNDAAMEAAWSRLYGGIHFRHAILYGIDQGRLVANVVLNTIRLK